MAKRKTLVFKTPKKVNKTPLKSQKSIVNVSNNSNDEFLNLNKNFKEVDEKLLNKRVNKKIDKEIKKGDNNFDFNENDLIKQLRKENDELRSLNNVIYIYQKLLGITINNDNNEYFVTIERESNNLKKYLSFGLKEINNSYQYKLYKNENCILPQRFVDDIQFENTEIHKFFYYIIQGMYNK
ncbi:hypothetical protein HERIO_196 [Hepatospora eriocheir]|uniref:DUF5094 domain-containing protein n=1 Tax=Hepatospora eriocheir TaxID=1081669 RepID=A0A1X0QDW1_9MICR|nr:hypothetical protein HERIO_196 [Hepatospora eriocheir]